MKDLLGRELEPGDLIADVRTSGNWKTAGIIHGGITKGGKIRYFSIEDHHTNSQEKCIIKIDKETFDLIVNEIKGTFIGYVTQREDCYWQKRINAIDRSCEKIGAMREEYNKEF